MFIPASPEEVRSMGWDRLDVILVTGDAYIDTPTCGAAVIGHWLISRGFRTGIIPQPIADNDDITRLGEPLLWWGVTSGSLDSMVSNYTSTGKRRNRDDLTPGGENNRRPDRALIAYVNMIRRHYKNTVPIVLGGIEASQRRVAHYDMKDSGIRRSILPDSKADILVYGMGERAVLEISGRLREGLPVNDIPGTCVMSREAPGGYIELPAFEDVCRDPVLFEEMFRVFTDNCEYPSPGLVQKHADRFLVQNPPAEPLTSGELDAVYELPYEREVHPLCLALGEVRAIDTVRFSITTHRGCMGQCAFCSIFLHQGRRIISRTPQSIVRELESMTGNPRWRGVLSDLGGPTANMYMMSCNAKRPCPDRRCLYPRICPNLGFGHAAQRKLLGMLRDHPGVRHVFVASGVRHDLVVADGGEGEAYLRDLVRHHVSGQMKIAPEHTEKDVLDLMGKPGRDVLLRFRDMFNRVKAEAGKDVFCTYYLMAAHPGCTMKHMEQLGDFVRRELHLRPEQVQVFTPLPSTWSSVMYLTGRDPVTGRGIFVERDRAGRERQRIFAPAGRGKGDRSKR